MFNNMNFLLLGGISELFPAIDGLKVSGFALRREKLCKDTRRVHHRNTDTPLRHKTKH